MPGNYQPMHNAQIETNRTKAWFMGILRHSGRKQAGLWHKADNGSNNWTCYGFIVPTDHTNRCSLCCRWPASGDGRRHSACNADHQYDGLDNDSTFQRNCPGPTLHQCHCRRHLTTQASSVATHRILKCSRALCVTFLSCNVILITNNNNKTVTV